MLKVFTDTGHAGVGEATNWPGSSKNLGKAAPGAFSLEK